MSTMKITKEWHKYIKETQSFLYYKYKKLVSSMIIMLHLSPSDINNPPSEVAHRISKELENKKTNINKHN